MTGSCMTRKNKSISFFPMLRHILRHSKSTYKRCREKMVLDSALRKIGDGAFFIQVGSNDGTAGDPLRRWIISRGWCGVMIEPVPHIFKRLQERYKDNKSITLLDVAIAPEGNNLKFYTIPEDIEIQLGEKLPRWHNQLSSFKRDNLVNHLDGKLERFVYALDVPTITLTELVQSYSINSIDVLHIDAEGFDYEVFATFPLAELKPRVLIIEHKHMSSKNLDDLLSILSTNGYRTTILSEDLLAELNSGISN